MLKNDHNQCSVYYRLNCNDQPWLICYMSYDYHSYSYWVISYMAAAEGFKQFLFSPTIWDILGWFFPLTRICWGRLATNQLWICQPSTDPHGGPIPAAHCCGFIGCTRSLAWCGVPAQLLWAMAQFALKFFDHVARGYFLHISVRVNTNQPANGIKGTWPLDPSWPTASRSHMVEAILHLEPWQEVHGQVKSGWFCLLGSHGPWDNPPVLIPWKSTWDTSTA